MNTFYQYHLVDELLDYVRHFTDPEPLIIDNCMDDQEFMVILDYVFFVCFFSCNIVKVNDICIGLLYCYIYFLLFFIIYMLVPYVYVANLYNVLLLIL